MPETPFPHAAPTVLVVNPTAGRGMAGRKITEIDAKLRALGLTDVTWRHTRKRGDACDMARQAVLDGAQTVVAVGGDGTLHEVMNGILGSSATLGLIPFGTGNDFARAVGLHGNLDIACSAIAGGVVKHMDVGTITGTGLSRPHHFLVLCGTGYDARTAQTVNEGVKYLSGAAAYVWGAILTLRTFRPFRLTLTLDNGAPRELSAMFCSIANTPTTGGGMRIAPGALIDDGLLDICLVQSVPKLTLLHQLTKVFDGKHIRHPAVEIIRASHIQIDADPPQPLLIDGEVLGTTPATVTLAPRLLPMWVPA